MHPVTRWFAFIGFTAAIAPLQAATLSETSQLWQPAQLTVEGPETHELAVSPNPFLDIRLDVTLTSPSGDSRVVPGFYAGDGNGGGSGTVWMMRFTPDQIGEWSYSVRFEQGEALAVAEPGTHGTALAGDGEYNTFQVVESSPDAPGFLAKGPLTYVGEHYLRFADGSYWIKGGLDSPENFLAYAGFDNTVKHRGSKRPDTLHNGLHAYPSHIEDWQTGDPLFESEDTGMDSKGIIGAVNYLASQGVNSLYLMTLNLGGDGRDCYPFIGSTGSFFDNTHYDVSKLRQWNVVLDHMQRKGIAAQLVLGEQEIDNTNWLDSGQFGPERKLYYRELAARFSYLNALKWNLSEESRFTDEQHRLFIRYLRSMDPAAHPIAVHTWVNQPAEQYEPLLGNEDVDITSIQFHPDRADEFTETWRQLSRDAGRPWVIDMDEQGPGNLGLSAENIEELRKSVLYPVLFSGGNIEWYFGKDFADIGIEDFTLFEPMYRYTRYARNLLEQHTPFQQMEPNDAALSGGHEQDQVFELSGQTHLLYLQDGHEGRQLDLPAGRYTMQWFDPRNGQFVQGSQSIGGGTLSIPAAPGDADEDWAVLIDSDPETRLPTSEEPTEPPAETPEQTPELGNAEPETPASLNTGRLDLALLCLFLMVWISRLTTASKSIDSLHLAFLFLHIRRLVSPAPVTRL